VYSTDTGLIGRDDELSWLRGVVVPPPAEGRVLVVLGDAGMGKTALLNDATHWAALAGTRVLSTSGRESEKELAFAGLHQLLRPILDRVAALPERQEKALLGALALSEDPVPSDALLTGIAVLTLLSGLSDQVPLLVVIDDAQWLDRDSLDAVAFAAHRLATERLVLLLGVRGKVPPAGFDRDFPQLPLQPLSVQDAGRLLDVQPRPPHGRAREQVLAQAAGNPMALIELSKAIAAEPSVGRRWAGDPLLPADRLTEVLATQFAALPSSTQSALLLAAVADSADLSAVTGTGLSADTLAPAESVGLIRVDRSGPHFVHPLGRAAAFHAAPFAQRAAAHRQIAEALHDQPDRHAWHLAAATLVPDEHVASLLEHSADQAQRRGGVVAAARALECAAEISPREQDQARRLLAAGALALIAGQADWVQELATRVLAVTSDPDLRIAARLQIGWALVWSNRHAEALQMVIAVAVEVSDRLPTMAWDAVGLAATVAYQSGIPASREEVLHTLDLLEVPAPPPADWPAGYDHEQRVWVQACTAPFSKRTETVPLLHAVAQGPVVELAKVGATAWLLDETELAVQLLREALSQLRAPGVRGGSGAALSALQWACIDGGRWDEALAAASEAADLAAAYKMETVAATADLVTATVLSMRGDHDRIESLLARAVATANGAEYRSVTARALHAAGLAELTQGKHPTAYAQLSKLFDADGAPLHHHASYLAIADLAAAAVRTEHRQATRELVDRALASTGPARGPRLDQLAARARGLLSDADPMVHFAEGLSDARGDSWPFERAQLQLDFGEWLRRQRHINDAKPLLSAALVAFRRLGAAPWVRRTEAELRASGVRVSTMPDNSDPLGGLTGQQREIIVLASRGLTNGEIADRLFLSPRTVASHLYRSYPKLGIAGRHQLRDLVDQAHEGPATR